MATIETSIAGSGTHDLAALFGQIYRVNGWAPMTVWDGFVDSAVAAGIAGPPEWTTSVTTGVYSTAALGGSTAVGSHVYRYRYVNSKTQYVGNPTNPIVFNVPNSNKSWILSNIIKSEDSKVDRIVLEATDAGGGAFFEATVLANQSQAASVQISDGNLRAKPLFWDNFGHDVPQFFDIIEPFKGRLWGLGQRSYGDGGVLIGSTIAGSGLVVRGSGTNFTSAAKGRFLITSGDVRRFIDSVVSGTELKLEETGPAQTLRNYTIISEAPDVLRWSKALFPESWPVENSLRVLEGQPEKAKAIKGWRRDLIILGERALERLVFTEDPFRDGALEPIEGERGAASRRVVQDVGGALYSLDYKGLMRFSGGTPEHISEAIDPLFDPGDRAQGFVDFTHRTTFHSVHYPNRHQILWFVVVNGDPDDSTVYTLPHHAIVYDYLNGSIALLKFDAAIVASTVAPGNDGTTQTLLADDNGRLWAYGISNTDGVHPDSVKSITIRSGTTSTAILFSGGTLYNTGDGLVGAWAYWIRGDEARLITANSASGMTVSGGFTSLSVTDVVTLGRIPARWKSKAFFLEDPSFRRFDGVHLHLYYEPQSSGKIRVRFFLDRLTTAYDKYELGYESEGVKQDEDTDYYEIDLTTASGYARIPLPSEGSHTLEFEIDIVDAATSFEMDGFSITGYAEESEVSS